MKKQFGMVVEEKYLNDSSVFISVLARAGLKVIVPTKNGTTNGISHDSGWDMKVRSMVNGKKEILVDITTSLEKKKAEGSVGTFAGMFCKEDPRHPQQPIIPLVIAKDGNPVEQKANAEKLAKLFMVALSSIK